MSELLEAALRYANQDRPVFPCQPRGKRPLTRNGLLDASTDPLIIKRWWTRLSPGANLGLRTGAISRLLVLDVDGDAGAESLRALEREHGPLPRTATVVTPGGGEDYYLLVPLRPCQALDVVGRLLRDGGCLCEGFARRRGCRWNAGGRGVRGRVVGLVCVRGRPGLLRH